MAGLGTDGRRPGESFHSCARLAIFVSLAMMKSWLSNRVDFIDQQLVQPPRLSRDGGRVAPGFLLTLTGPSNTSVYHTLDDSDPRQSQGGISSNAVLYTGPIPLKANARLVARARNPNQRQTDGPPSSTPWSGPVAAQYVITAP